jgi:acetoin utilization deacetylase AcuC-like enzyme
VGSVTVFSDLRVTGYERPGHPEAPWRVGRPYDRLKTAGLLPKLPTVLATEKDVLSVHTRPHWEMLQTGRFRDPDTPFFPGIHELALTSLSGALSALNSALENVPAFSLMRPPGHHAAQERIAGFCYINHMAIACRRVLSQGRRVAVLDIDVHHGDGTEAIAFGQKDWLYVSLHQMPLYPGTGAVSRGNCLNFPLPPFTGEADYLEVLESALENILAFKPDILGVSAGFDTYKDCPLAQFRLEADTYRKIGKMISQTGIKRFAILEGGYSEDLPILIEKFLMGFAG